MPAITIPAATPALTSRANSDIIETLDVCKEGKLIFEDRRGCGAPVPMTGPRPIQWPAGASHLRRADTTDPFAEDPAYGG
jgi:hypothetical protein